MEIRKRNNGSIAYRAKVYVGNIPITKTFDRKTDAKAWEFEQRRKKQRGELDLNKIEDIRFFESAFDSWFKTTIKSKAVKTQSDYKSIGNKYLLPLFGSILLKDLSLRHGDLLTEKLAEKNSSKNGK